MPLAPDQHRLTDDGEASKPSQNGLHDQQGKAMLKGQDEGHVGSWVASHDGEEEEQQISQFGAAEGSQGSAQQPLLGAVAQIKVVDLCNAQLVCLFVCEVYHHNRHKI